MNAPEVDARSLRQPIVAIATASGKAGVGIVRVSGSRLDLEALVLGVIGKALTPRLATKVRFLDSQGRAMDEGLALYFQGPNSYTGEDVLELQGHGGPVVLHMMVRRCVELGATLAQPGEFTRRAFLNDKMDLAQAEAVADLIDAASEAGARCAIRSLRGEFSTLINTLVAQLVELRALVEAVIDFPEEEIDASDRLQAVDRLSRLFTSVTRALEQSRRGSLLRAGMGVVIAGRPNMGKSSLLNALAGEEIAIVTAMAGTTRDPVKQSIQIEGVPINIIDTAGLRDSADVVENIGIAKAWHHLDTADCAILVVEDEAGITQEDEAILEKLPAAIPRIVVFNKIDLSGRRASREISRDLPCIYLSSKTGEGIDLLRAELLRVAGWQSSGEDVFMARARHIDALERTLAGLKEAAKRCNDLELLAEELRQAHLHLQSITGEYCADDLLGEIFSRFCIGK